MNKYDVVVIGTGTSGTTVATLCAKARRRVAIIDERRYGGTCELRGCDPKKVLVGVAELVDWSRRMRGSGVSGSIQIDWAQLMRFKHSFTDPVPAQREAELRELGVTTYHGVARFIDGSTIGVDGQALESERIVIAAGAHPAALGISGEHLLITSTDFLDLRSLPRRIVFIGGGYIAFEFAHLAARAGASPVILQRGPRVLTGFEPSLVDSIVDVSRELGIEVRLNEQVNAIERGPTGLRVHSGTQEGESWIDCDLAVHAAGRTADLDALALDAAGVERDSKGVAVNEFLQSRTNPAVYAVGDCADGGGLPLTPTAAAQGEAAARNILEGNRHTVDYGGLVSIVYTIPALGMTGLTQTEARDRNINFEVRAADSTQWYSSRRVCARVSRHLLLIEDGTQRIVGAHVLGPHAEELLNVFSLAIRAQIDANVLEAALFGYPTASSDIASMLETK